MKRKNRVSWVDVPGGEFQPGSEHAYVEERGRARARVEPFQLGRTPVTNAQFGQFVRATGYQTTAELPPEPGVEPGSLVFVGTSKPVPLEDHRLWWAWVPGAHWERPNGPGSELKGRWDHPVVHVSLDDARAFADWVHARLPTEDELEWAMRGHDPDPPFDAPPPQDANVWRGSFPWWRTESYGSKFVTTPVDRFPPNELGLYDLIGNTWTWTSTPWVEPGATPSACCSPQVRPGDERFVRKGGSFACARDGCRRYRPSARLGGENHSTANHLGFRVARDTR